MPVRLSLTLILTVVALGAAAPRARAALDPQNFVNATDKVLSDIAGLVGLGFDLHAYESVRPYSTLTGFDVGASLTAVTVPGDVVQGLTNLGIPNVPHYLPVPKINVHKGFNNRLFIGSEFIPTIKIQGSAVSMVGFDVQWTLVDRPRFPPVSLRAQYSYTDLVFVRTSTFGVDGIMGWQLPIVDVYGGAGYRFVKAGISNPTATLPVQLNVNFNPALDAGHFVVGVVVVAGFARITTEANLTTRGVNTYGTKLSFFF